MATNRIAGEGIKDLTRLKSLGFLDLKDTLVTDAFVNDLAEFKGLSLMWLDGTQVTAKGRETLRAALKCYVTPN